MMSVNKVAHFEILASHVTEIYNAMHSVKSIFAKTFCTVHIIFKLNSVQNIHD